MPVRQLQVQTPVAVGQYLLQQSSSRLQEVPTTLQTPPELLPELDPALLVLLLLLAPLLLPPELVPPVLEPPLLVPPVELDATLVELPLEPVLEPVVVETLVVVLEPPLLVPCDELLLDLLLEPPLDEPPKVRQPMPASVSVQVAPVQQSFEDLHGQGGMPSPELHWQVSGPPS